MTGFIVFLGFVALIAIGDHFRKVEEHQRRERLRSIGQWCYFEEGEKKSPKACGCKACRKYIKEEAKQEAAYRAELAAIEAQEKAEEEATYSEWAEGLSEEERAAVEAMEQKHFEKGVAN
ncbi:MAG: hypothetical protein ACRDCE_15495 [Cetobacterium sp.]|uniref:hypothetical protein n=1 Tax=Cetobacterium sp. TaxID=2071632 RepID=UPI003EE76A63